MARREARVEAAWGSTGLDDEAEPAHWQMKMQGLVGPQVHCSRRKMSGDAVDTAGVEEAVEAIPRRNASASEYAGVRCAAAFPGWRCSREASFVSSSSHPREAGDCGPAAAVAAADGKQVGAERLLQTRLNLLEPSM